jgi:Mor family transcriptional regulator
MKKDLKIEARNKEIYRLSQEGINAYDLGAKYNLHYTNIYHIMAAEKAKKKLQSIDI